ncbi:ASCH domain-containing protein [Pseudomonas nitroreducens]|uniref:ASCH domain-containing protein n=1 Tax=Pseudomonas nitroreducens TaxID=46680 RepID=A0ABS0KIC8_PSENT|nr:ASCH domain-containing protein [Pseudomonas nitroreducens]MBG6287718.1 ASCH domain-containing protein [Pseudomonas nitroreducens]
MKALSIRQPWAWLVVNGFKPIENRDWPTRYRGRFLVHASKGMTRDEYEDARDLAHELGITIPAPHELERGGIVGEATITGCVDHSASPWFFGKFGFALVDAKQLPFRPLKGQLGFFDVEVAP